MYNFEFSSKLKPQKGYLLISEPFMQDDYFERSVVLLCEYDKNEGAFGFVLNKYLEVELDELSKVIPKFKTKLSLGGPVGNNELFFIHELKGIPNSIEIRNGLYIGGDFDYVKDYITNGSIKSDQIRFFVGYSGWSPKQLENEIEEGAWIVSPIPSNKTIMDTDNEDLWKIILQKKGGKFKIISHFPTDPSLN